MDSPVKVIIACCCELTLKLRTCRQSVDYFCGMSPIPPFGVSSRYLNTSQMSCSGELQVVYNISNNQQFHCWWTEQLQNLAKKDNSRRKFLLRPTTQSVGLQSRANINNYYIRSMVSSFHLLFNSVRSNFQNSIVSKIFCIYKLLN